MTTTPQTFEYGSQHLTAGIVLSISRGKTRGILTDSVRDKIRASSQTVKNIALGDKAVYGINTGFGPLCTTLISKDQTSELQRNLLMSHAVGLGDPVSDEIARLMMILKVHALARGFSGVKEHTIDRIIWHIDHNITPLVPEQGSVGASGDLAPLSHLFLPLIGLGKVKYLGEVKDTADVLKKEGRDPIELGAKEGLGLINGTQFIAAFAIKVVEKLHNVMATADISGAMMIEGLLASVKPFSEELHNLRAYKGNQHVAHRIRQLLHQSEIVNSHVNCARVQDPYSLRCIPQVHGASRNAWLHLKQMLEIEINSVTDNPVVFDEDHTISGGNFHGQPMALPLDYACLAAAEIGNISDRRIYLSLEGDTPGVPKLLLKETGTNSGFMIPQYTSAALVSENKGLCFPASADSVPTSLGQEDHVSMGSIGGRKALRVIENVEKIIGIEVFCAAQAIDFHRPLKSSKTMASVHQHVRSRIAHIQKDGIMNEYMETAIRMVKDMELASIMQHQLDSKTVFSEEFDQF